MGVNHAVVYAVFALEVGQRRLKLGEVAGQGLHGSVYGPARKMDDPDHGSNLLNGAFGPGMSSSEDVDGSASFTQGAG